ncbi:hypothetical protein ACFVYE_35795 [Streptomyces sp. NPDC058239]|uniref:hypothetical protein n=1 Tax=Streptomyces sp. NPDC058239 TaxID=3346395 RepID=UPI0036E827DB
MWVENDKNTYWWGASWWNTTPIYNAKVNVTVKFSAQYDVGFSGKFKDYWTQTSRSHRSLAGTIPMDRCGGHGLNVTYNQVGAYYNSDKEIDASRSYNDFVIPCTVN